VAVSKRIKQNPQPTNLWENAVQRRAATLLLREIINFPEVIPFTCVYLKRTNRSRNPQLDDFELHVKTNQDFITRRIIENLALQQGLLVQEESDGFLAIYTPGREPLEITA
jgi:hypothetical protein